MRARSLLTLVAVGIAAVMMNLATPAPSALGRSLSAPAGALPTKVDITKSAAESLSWPGSVINNTITISLPTASSNVVIDDTFMYGLDYVAGSGKLDGVPTPDPALISSIPDRKVYRFQFATLPAGVHYLTHQAQVSPTKNCSGLKVHNDVRLTIAGRFAKLIGVDVPFRCTPPAQFGVVSQGPGTSNSTFISSALRGLGAGSYYSYESNAAQLPGRVEMVRPGVNLATLASTVNSRKGAAWLIGNEPNVPGQDDMTPQAYATFLRDVSTVIKKADRTAILVGPNVLNWNLGCSVAGCSDGYNNAQAWSDSLLTSYQLSYKARPPLDVWGIHAYTLDWSKLPTMFNATTDQAQITASRGWLNTHGWSNLPIWLSEFGVIWGYPGYSCASIGPGGQCVYPISPQGSFQTGAVLNYMDSMMRWLTGPNATKIKLQRWFLYATLPPAEPYATAMGGINLLQYSSVPPNPPVLSTFGQRYLEWASGARH